MKLKFIPADQNALTGAKVIDIETGEEIKNVRSVTYTHIAGSVSTLLVEVYLIPGEKPGIEGEIIAEGIINEVNI